MAKKPAHNTKLRLPITYRGREFVSLGMFVDALDRKPAVSPGTLSGRIRRRFSGNAPWNDPDLDDCLYLSIKEYSSKYRVRVTWIQTARGKRRADELHTEALATVSYSNFRQRLVSISKRKAPLDDAIISEAATLAEADWISRYGGGRRRPFLYDGSLHPEHRGSHPGFTAFLKAIGRYQDKELLNARRKAKWEIDDLLREPPARPDQPGYIYRITEVSSGRSYVGLSVNPPCVRFSQHLRDARQGGSAPLHQAISSSGETGFNLTVLEEVSGGEGRLAEREKHWIEELGTRFPDGFNVKPGGETGRYDGKSVEWNGRSFPSMAKMARTLAKETGLAEHVILRRFSEGKPLPERARKHSKHPEAGSQTFRQWLGLLKRAETSGAGVDEVWQDYEVWKRDVNPDEAEGMNLTRRDEAKPWGPGNWIWMPHSKIVERTHGKRFEAMGRTWPSAAAACREFGVPRNVYRYRVASGWPIEKALTTPIGPTSKKKFTFGGETFPSRNKAIEELARRHGVTVHKAKDRIVRGIPTSQWASMHSSGLLNRL